MYQTQIRHRTCGRPVGIYIHLFVSCGEPNVTKRCRLFTPNQIKVLTFNRCLLVNVS